MAQFLATCRRVAESSRQQALHYRAERGKWDKGGHTAAVVALDRCIAVHERAVTVVNEAVKDPVTAPAKLQVLVEEIDGANSQLQMAKNAINHQPATPTPP